MSFIKHDAPRTLLSFIWATAVMLTIFFAVILSSFFVLKHYYPVDASSVETPAQQVETTTCKGTEVSINNYPGPTNIIQYIPGPSQDKTSKVIEPLGGLFQCSRICVPDLAAGTIDSAMKTKVAEFLNGGSIAGKPIVEVDNGEAFMAKWKEWNNEKDPSKKQLLAEDLKRTVIISQTKVTCVGPISTDYAKPIIGKAGQEAPITKKNDTVEKANIAQAQQKAASEKADAVAPVPIAGPAEKNQVSAPVVTTGDGNGTSKTKGSAIVTGSTNASTDLASCQTKVNNFIDKYQQILNIAPQTETDPDMTRFAEIKADYQAIKKEPYLSDTDKAFTQCLKIEKLVDAMANKLWGTDTDLAKCKKDVEGFLTGYKSKPDISELAKKFYDRVALLNTHIKTNPWYRVSAIRQMKVCKEMKTAIQEYKVEIGTMIGPNQQTPERLADSQASLATQIASDIRVNARIINYRMTGKVYWNLSSNLVSKKAVICVAATRSVSDGSYSGDGTEQIAGKDGSFDFTFTFYGQHLGDRGVAIMFADPGGAYPAKNYLVTTDAEGFKKIISNQLIQKNTFNANGDLFATATYGNVDLQRGFGSSRAIKAQFKELTGQNCN